MRQVGQLPRIVTKH